MAEPHVSPGDRAMIRMPDQRTAHPHAQVYTVAGGKNIPGWLSETKKKALKKDDEYRRRHAAAGGRRRHLDRSRGAAELSRCHRSPCR